MVKKNTIGKIQVIIGIILLIGGIVGLISIKMTNNNFQIQLQNQITWMDQDYDVIEQDDTLSNESKLLLKLTHAEGLRDSFMTYGYGITQILLASGIAIVLSLLFITQGFANIGVKNE